MVARRGLGETNSSDKTVVLRQDCALTDLEVGDLPIPAGNTVALVAVALLQIFPRLHNIEFIEEKWKDVLEFIRATRRLGSFVKFTSKAYLSYSYIRPYSVTFSQTTYIISGHQRNNVFRRFWIALTLLGSHQLIPYERNVNRQMQSSR